MRINAYLEDNLIKVRFPETAADHAEVVRKEVSASRKAYRRHELPAFTYPLSVEKCREMRDAWGNRLKIHNTLGDWYREAAKERAAQVAITKQTDATLVRVAAQYPALNAWLKGDQRVTARWVAQAHRGGGLLADEVGTGKTGGVVAGLVEAGITGPTLIVCPKISVRAVWLKELTKHTNIPVYACSGSRKKREAEVAAFYADATPFKVLVVVAEMLRVKAFRDKGRVTEFLGYEYPALFDTEWSCVVVDESHKLLGSMDVVRATLAGEGLRNLSYAPNRLKLAVSATPFGKGGRVEALFGTLHWLWPDEFGSRWAWLRKYFEINEDRVFVRGGGGASKMVQRVGRLLEEDKLWEDLGARVLRRTMEEVSPEHRGLKNFIEVPCEMEPIQLAQYRRFAQDAELAVEGGLISTVGVLDFMTRSRQFANGALRKEGGRVVYTGVSGKIEQLMEHLDQLAVGRKVVIASQFNEYLDVVEARLAKEGYRWFRLDGSTTERQRESMMEDFQGPSYNGLMAQGPLVTFEGPDVTCRTCNVSAGRKHGARCRVNQPTVFLLNGQAGGVSITLDAADELHELDEMYPPEANTQLFGRIFRRGRVHEVFFYLYRSMGTIDEHIGYNVDFGAEQQARLLDGRRGQNYVRELAKYKGDL